MKLVKVNAHLSDLSFFASYNKVYARYFPDPKPARTTVGSQLMGILVEIDAIAYVERGLMIVDAVIDAVLADEAGIA